MPRSPRSPDGANHANSVGKAGATRIVGLPLRSTLPRRTSRYNSAYVGVSKVDRDRSYMLMRRWIDTYEFTIVGTNPTIDLAPAAARRLVANLTAALRANGHWKD